MIAKNTKSQSIAGSYPFMKRIIIKSSCAGALKRNKFVPDLPYQHF